jgi:hypothetical protein
VAPKASNGMVLSLVPQFMIIIVYGSILAPFSNNRAAKVGVLRASHKIFLSLRVKFE